MRKQHGRHQDHRRAGGKPHPFFPLRALFRRRFFVQARHHAFGKACRRVIFLQVAERKAHRHQLCKAGAAALASFHMGKNLIFLLLRQFSVNKGRERWRVFIAVFHVAPLSFRLHSVTFDETDSKKFPLAVK